MCCASLSRSLLAAIFSVASAYCARLHWPTIISLAAARVCSLTNYHHLTRHRHRLAVALHLLQRSAPLYYHYYYSALCCAAPHCLSVLSSLPTDTCPPDRPAPPRPASGVQEPEGQSLSHAREASRLSFPCGYTILSSTTPGHVDCYTSPWTFLSLYTAHLSGSS